MAAVIVVLLAAMLIQGLITNPRLDWPTVWKYLFNENVLEGIRYTLELTVISMVVAIILSVILAIMRKSINPVLRGVSWFFIWFFRGTPVYTQLIFLGSVRRADSQRLASAFRSPRWSSGASTPTWWSPHSTPHGLVWL